MDFCSNAGHICMYVEYADCTLKWFLFVFPFQIFIHNFPLNSMKTQASVCLMYMYVHRYIYYT